MAGLLGRADLGVGAKDPIGEQAEAGQVGEPGALGEPGQDREVEPGPQARDGQVVADDPFHGGAGRRPAGGLADGLGHGVAGAGAEQGHEPEWSKPTATTTQSKASRSGSWS
jgi:hypothetical protein